MFFVLTHAVNCSCFVCVGSGLVRLEYSNIDRARVQICRRDNASVVGEPISKSATYMANSESVDAMRVKLIPPTHLEHSPSEVRHTSNQLTRWPTARVTIHVPENYTRGSPVH